MGILELLKILSNSTKRLPQLKYTWGLLGIAIVASIIFSLFGSGKASITAVSLSLIGTIVVFVASVALSHSKIAAFPALLLVWSVTIFFIIFLSFTVSVFVIGKPCNWGHFIGVIDSCDKPPIIPYPIPDVDKKIIYEGDLLIVEVESGRAAIAFDPKGKCGADYRWKFVSSYFNRWTQGYGEVTEGIGYSFSSEKHQRKSLEQGIVQAGQVEIKTECRDKKSIYVYKDKDFKDFYIINDSKLEAYEFYLSEQDQDASNVNWACHCFLNNTDSKILTVFSPSTPVGNRGTFDSQVYEPKSVFNRCAPIEFVIGYEIFSDNSEPNRNPFHHLGGTIWTTLVHAKNTDPFKNCTREKFSELINSKQQKENYWIIDYKDTKPGANKKEITLFSIKEYLERGK